MALKVDPWSFLFNTGLLNSYDPLVNIIISLNLASVRAGGAVTITKYLSLLFFANSLD